jgi:arylsulfatase A-like enzyme
MRPNILYIFTDQQSADAMSAAGNPCLHTPAMDRIAAAGVRFDRAYTAFPLCIPARMAMFTGRMPHELGVNVNCRQSETPPPAAMLGRLMGDAGYACHYVGKWHLTVPEAAREVHGFAEIVPAGIKGGGLDRSKADAAVAFLSQRHDSPFFLVVSFLNPHDCCELARGQELRMGPLPPEPSDGELPPLPSNWTIPEGEPDVYRRFQQENPRIGRAADWDEGQTRRYRWGYNRLVEMVDGDIGRILEAVESRRLAKDTVVIFSSDHGDGQGAHHWNQKWVFYEESVRVPFIVAGAGIAGSGRVDDRLVSASLDLVPTICDYAGIAAPEGCHGMSVRPLVEGREVASWRKWVAAETTFGIKGLVGEDQWPKGRMVRSERYKYVVVDDGSPREQLIDLERDPGEMANLATSSQHRAVLEEHRGVLREWCERTNDSAHPFDACG